MVSRRTSATLILVGCAVIAGTSIGSNGSPDVTPITKQRLADEMYGDPEMAGCVHDSLTEEGISPNVFNDLLNEGADDRPQADVSQALLDELTAVVLDCAPITVLSPQADEIAAGIAGGPAGDAGDADQNQSDETDSAEYAIEGETSSAPDLPALRINDDGSADVVWVPSTEMQRVDPDIPLAASNRTD